MANDPKLACMNFLSALEKIPKVIENHERKLEKVKRDVETYKAIASCEWKKEGELRKLKSELSELDRKISLTINKSKDNDKELGVKIDASGEVNNRIDKGNDGIKVKWR